MKKVFTSVLCIFALSFMAKAQFQICYDATQDGIPVYSATVSTTEIIFNQTTGCYELCTPATCGVPQSIQVPYQPPLICHDDDYVNQSTSQIRVFFDYPTLQCSPVTYPGLIHWEELTNFLQPCYILTCDGIELQPGCLDNIYASMPLDNEIYANATTPKRLVSYQMQGSCGPAISDPSPTNFNDDCTCPELLLEIDGVFYPSLLNGPSKTNGGTTTYLTQIPTQTAGKLLKVVRAGNTITFSDY